MIFSKFIHVLFFISSKFSKNSKIGSSAFNNIASLVSALKEKLNESKLGTAATISIDATFPYHSYDFSAMSDAVDFINFIFEYTRTESAYRIDDALKLMKTVSLKISVEKLIKAGAQPKKMVVGIHFTGPAFSLTGKGDVGDAPFLNTFGYGSTCKAAAGQPDNWSKSISPSGLTALKKTGGAKKFALAIENSHSIANKVRELVKLGITGFAPIHIYNDDIDGDCSIDDDTFVDFKTEDDEEITIPEINPKFGLLRTINWAIDVTLDEIEGDSDDELYN